MRILPVVFLALAVAACGSRESAAPVVDATSPPARTVSSELPAGAKASSQVLEMRKIAGVWRSAPGVLSDGPARTIQLEIAFDRSFSMTLWGKDPKGPGQAVFARQAGRIGSVPGGFAGSAAPGPRSPLSVLATWSAKGPEDGRIVLTSPKGDKVLLRRSGN